MRDSFFSTRACANLCLVLGQILFSAACSTERDRSMDAPIVGVPDAAIDDAEAVDNMVEPVEPVDSSVVDPCASGATAACIGNVLHHCNEAGITASRP